MNINILISPNTAICSSPCGTNKQCIAPDTCTCVSGWTGSDCLTSSTAPHVPVPSPTSITPYVPAYSPTPGHLSTTPPVPSSPPTSAKPLVSLTTYLIIIIAVVIVILLLSISSVVIIIKICLKRRKRIQAR